MLAWSAERIELLRKMVPQGHSYSLIAAEISALPGPGVSRNAAIGKATRLGIAQSRAGYAALSRKQRAARKITSKPRLIHPDRAQQAVLQAKIEAFRAEPDIVVPPEERRQLLDLENGDCRWPIGSPGEPGFTFCNRLQIGTDSRLRRGVLPYCDLHCRRGYEIKAPRGAHRSPAPSKRESVDA